MNLIFKTLIINDVKKQRYFMRIIFISSLILLGFVSLNLFNQESKEKEVKKEFDAISRATKSEKKQKLIS